MFRLANSPWCSFINCLPINIQPRPNTLKAVQKNWIHSTISGRADIQEQVPIVCDRFDQGINQLFRGEIVLKRRRSVVSPAASVNGHGVLPFLVHNPTRLIPIGAGQKAPMHTKGVRTPPVVPYSGLNCLRIPGKEFTRAPVVTVRLPFSVTPNQFRGVFHDQILQLGNRFHGHKVICRKVIFAILQIHWVEPFVKRMVHTKLDGLSSLSARCIFDGLCQFAQQVAPWAHIHNVPVPRGGYRVSTIPHAVSIMMFARQHHILSPRLCKRKGPFGRVEEFSLKSSGKFLVTERRPFGFVHELPNVGAWPPMISPIGTEPFRAQGRHGKDSPVQEYAKFGLVIPLR
mmetsp:Transcript_4085/g.11137  ORF Transcript_4085/g.11137 Transcript_4085/m.11137 type:complete len:344 (-) Transcript_4085:184-1215(-)